jgi:putative ABC transport system permease protein
MPTILGLSVGLPFTLYGWRLRRRPVQEALAAAGIAVGVALVFGVLVVNTSISGSVRSLVHQLIGSAQIQLAARSQQGFSQSVVGEVEALRGVEAASPILRENVTLANGPRRGEAVQLIGVTLHQLSLNPTVTRDLGAGAQGLISGGIALPQRVAEALGAHPEGVVSIKANGTAQKVPVRTILDSQAVGAVASSPVAITLLPTAQRLTGERDRVTNILIRARPDALASVTRSLQRIAAGRISVTPADSELHLFDAAVKPNQQSTTLFAAIAGMVGFLLALNAMLMTVPERRRLVAELRTFGYDPAQIGLLLMVQAVILGLLGSAIGIVAGYVLAHTLFGGVPNYLTAAFPVGGARIVTASTIILAIACGVLAALVASARPLLDLRPGYSMDTVMHEQGEAGQKMSRRTTVLFALAGFGLVLIATVLAAAVPSLTIIGGALLALAATCLVPLAYKTMIALVRPLSERSKGTFSIAAVELEATATRSITLTAIAALAVYGSLAIGGAKTDLTHGLETAIAQYESTADVWVTTGNNVFNTDSFQPLHTHAAIAGLRDVASVRPVQGALLDVGNRRLMIRAHSIYAPAIIQPSQLVHGDLDLASRLIRQGGWATVSQGYAAEHGLRLDSHFVLPTPSGGLPLGVAAITTNLGWPAGAITVSTPDYIRGWKTAAPTAFEVMLKPRVALTAGRAAVQSALGSGSALGVQTYREREIQTDNSARQGLQSLGEISTLILIAGALAVAASLSAAIWQRRARLAAMKTWGYDHVQLWRSMLVESLILLVVGGGDGAILGLYGHALADRWLRATTDFPAPFAIGGPQVFLTLALLVGIAMAVLAVPGLTAARVSPSVSFQE